MTGLQSVAVLCSQLKLKLGASNLLELVRMSIDSDAPTLRQ
jgi:hypothetical protein